MIDVWLIAGQLLAALIGGMIAGSVGLAIGGLGGLRTLRTELRSLSADLEKTDERITREVKTRASKAGVEVRRGVTEADIKAEAVQLLRNGQEAGDRLPRAGKRPSVVRG